MRAKDDSETRIINFLPHHPGSTAGGIAKGLNLEPAKASSHLTQLAQAAEIKKTAHGYSMQQAAGPGCPSPAVPRTEQVWTRQRPPVAAWQGPLPLSDISP